MEVMTVKIIPTPEKSFVTNNRVVVIFNPDSAFKHALFFRVFAKRKYVEDQAVHLTEKVALQIVETVVVAVKPVHVWMNHLRKTLGKILHLYGEHRFRKIRYWAALARAFERQDVNVRTKFRLTQEIVIVNHDSRVSTKGEFLEVGLRDGNVILETLDQCSFPRTDFVNDLVGIVEWSLCRGGQANQGEEQQNKQKLLHQPSLSPGEKG